MLILSSLEAEIKSISGLLAAILEFILSVASGSIRNSVFEFLDLENMG